MKYTHKTREKEKVKSKGGEGEGVIQMRERGGEKRAKKRDE